MSRSSNSPRWRVITAYLNATPSRSTPPLFLRTPAPGGAPPPRAAVADSPARPSLPGGQRRSPPRAPRRAPRRTQPPRLRLELFTELAALPPLAWSRLPFRFHAPPPPR